MELININSIRVMAEKKLRQQAARQNRDLRLILGHFEILDQINGCHFDKAAKHKSKPMMTTATTATPSVNRDAGAEPEQSPVALHIEEVAIVDDDDDDDTVQATTNKALSTPNTLPWHHEKFLPDVECIELEEGSSSDEESVSDEDEADKDMYYDAPEFGSELVHHSPPSFVDHVSVPGVDKAAQYLYTAFEESVHEVGDDD